MSIISELSRLIRTEAHILSTCTWGDIRLAGIEVQGVTDGLKLLPETEIMGKVVNLFKELEVWPSSSTGQRSVRLLEMIKKLSNLSPEKMEYLKGKALSLIEKIIKKESSPESSDSIQGLLKHNPKIHF